jgi:hypothetical protein
MKKISTIALLIFGSRLLKFDSFFLFPCSPLIFSHSSLKAKCNNAKNQYLEDLHLWGSRIDKRFFFPSHSGGINLPKRFKEAFEKNPFRYDLPELDETDNIHSPHVRMSVSYTSLLFKF